MLVQKDVIKLFKTKGASILGLITEGGSHCVVAWNDYVIFNFKMDQYPKLVSTLCDLGHISSEGAWVNPTTSILTYLDGIPTDEYKAEATGISVNTTEGDKDLLKVQDTVVAYDKKFTMCFKSVEALVSLDKKSWGSLYLKNEAGEVEGRICPLRYDLKNIQKLLGLPVDANVNVDPCDSNIGHCSTCGYENRIRRWKVGGYCTRCGSKILSID